MPLNFAPVDPAAEPAAGLIAAMEAEMVALYDISDGVVGVPLHAEELRPPHGVFLVGREDDTPVAGGGLRRIGDGVGEIKRMFVVAGARGRGLAAALLSALEDEARARGLLTVRLDTGPEQPYARRLYENAGYRLIPNYNGNPHAAFWYEKRLEGG